MHHMTAKKFAHIAQVLEDDYTILLEHDGDSFVASFDGEPFADYDKVPSVEQVVEDYNDFEAGEDEAGGSVVKDHYKRIYAERGDVNNCGDWLAQVLASLFHTADGKLDFVAFFDCCVENGVQPSRKLCAMIETRTNGWQGRARMSLRRALEVRIAYTAEFRVGGTQVLVDADWLEEMQAKHRKALAKLVKEAVDPDFA